MGIWPNNFSLVCRKHGFSGPKSGKMSHFVTFWHICQKWVPITCRIYHTFGQNLVKIWLKCGKLGLKCGPKGCQSNPSVGDAVSHTPPTPSGFSGPNRTPNGTQNGAECHLLHGKPRVPGHCATAPSGLTHTSGLCTWFAVDDCLIVVLLALTSANHVHFARVRPPPVDMNGDTLAAGNPLELVGFCA